MKQEPKITENNTETNNDDIISANNDVDNAEIHICEYDNWSSE